VIENSSFYSSMALLLREHVRGAPLSEHERLESSIRRAICIGKSSPAKIRKSLIITMPLFFVLSQNLFQKLKLIRIGKFNRLINTLTLFLMCELKLHFNS
jgi:hypothetical protein